MEERKEVPLEATPTETKPEEGWMDWAWGKTKDVGNTVRSPIINSRLGQEYSYRP